jgi:hypothetical protein
MIVETVEDANDSEGRSILTVKGRSLEAILEDRVAMASLTDLTTSPKWVITDTPTEVARKIFHDICVTGILDTQDIIPFVVEDTIMPTDTIPEPADPITVELDPQTVYNAIRDLSAIWVFGFRLLRNFDSSQLYFDVYMGSDRTTSQTILPAVVFTPELDNLQNTTELTTIDKAKNVAYVFSPAGVLMVYAPNVDPDIEGFERRILNVIASDITVDNPDIPAALLQRGLEELAKNRTFQAFDGEINPNSTYKYQTHYYLGDIVEVRNRDGLTNKMRIVEQIFVSDGEGERSYPTLALNQFVTTGSWLSMRTEVWDDFTTEYWADMP